MNKSTQRLIEFAEYMNRGMHVHPVKPAELIVAGSGMTHSLYRQSYPEAWESGKPHSLRASGLGRPAVLQAMTWLGFNKDEVLANRTRQIFSFGDWAESYLLAHLASFPGVSLDHRQAEITWEGIKGHTDASVTFEGDTTLLDVKTMAGYKVPKVFSKSRQHPDLLIAKDFSTLDASGYITQSAIYMAALGLDEWAWLIWDKGTFEIKVGIYERDTKLTPYLQRAQRIITLFQDLNEFEDIFRLGIDAPEPVPHICRRKETGHAVLPESMRWTVWRDVFYELENIKDCYSKEKEVVIKKREPEEAHAHLKTKLAS